MRAWLIAIFAIASLAVGCSDKAKPPEGRWQGVYMDDGVMIAARVEVESDGRVRLSAPNAFMDFASLAEGDKLDVQARLTQGLAGAWPHVPPREFDFDGRVFRNPGGVAPQLEWDPKTERMTMYVYAGAKPTIHISLERVRDFGG